VSRHADLCNHGAADGRSGGSDVICAAAERTSPLSGIIPMYVVMRAFHPPPWLKLVSSRGNGTRLLRLCRSS
jgi:hypothetical protein